MDKRLFEIINDFIGGKGSFFGHQLILVDQNSKCKYGHPGPQLLDFGFTEVVGSDEVMMQVSYHCLECEKIGNRQNGFYELNGCPHCKSFDTKFLKREVTASGNNFAEALHTHQCNHCQAVWQVVHIWSD